MFGLKTYCEKYGRMNEDVTLSMDNRIKLAKPGMIGETLQSFYLSRESLAHLLNLLKTVRASFL